MKKYRVDYEMIIGEGMFHCYPVFPICKEGKDGWNMMVRLIKNGDSRKYRTSLPIVSGRSTCVRGRFFPCRARYRLPGSARLQVSAIARKSTFHLAPKHCTAHILF